MTQTGRTDALPRDSGARALTSAGEAPLLAGVELGGTKAIALLGRAGEIITRQAVPTTTSEATFAELSALFAGWRARHGVPAAIGIASFGPVRLDPRAEDYGRILPTTKVGWHGADLIAALAPIADGPCMLDTDVTAAALAEGRWGAAQGFDDFVYITLGTGIGGGVIVAGRPVVGAMHSELGHMRVRRMAGDAFAGICEFHGDCLEGLASGPAVAARAGRPAYELSSDAPEWVPVIDALAEGLATLSLVLAPQRILIGGGLGVGQTHLLPPLRSALLAKLQGFLPAVTPQSIEAFVMAAGLGDRAGPLGALLLAQTALDEA